MNCPWWQNQSIITQLCSSTKLYSVSRSLFWFSGWHFYCFGSHSSHIVAYHSRQLYQQHMKADRHGEPNTELKEVNIGLRFIRQPETPTNINYNVALYNLDVLIWNFWYYIYHIERWKLCQCGFSHLVSAAPTWPTFTTAIDWLL